jgi:hypothetical protein
MVVQQNTLLATKLHIPHLRMDVVQRPRLTRSWSISLFRCI